MRRGAAVLALALALAGCGEEEAGTDRAADRAKPNAPIPEGYFAVEAPAPPQPPPRPAPPPVEPPPPPPPPPQPPAPPVEEPAAGPELPAPDVDVAALVRARAEKERRDAILAGGGRVVAAKAVEGPPKAARDTSYEAQGIGADRSSRPVDRRRMVMAGTPIPGRLATSLNSQLPGVFRVWIARPVYAAEGPLDVLPKGSEALCRYEPLGKQGATRLPVVCERITRTDGASVVLTNATGADAEGRNGFIGVIDNRIWERYGDAFVMASLSALVALADDGTRQTDALGRSTQSAAERLAETTAQILDKTLDLAPISSAAKGDRVVIVLSTDLWLADPAAAPVASAEPARPASPGNGGIR